MVGNKTPKQLAREAQGREAMTVKCENDVGSCQLDANHRGQCRDPHYERDFLTAFIAWLDGTACLNDTRNRSNDELVSEYLAGLHKSEGPTK